MHVPQRVSCEQEKEWEGQKGFLGEREDTDTWRRVTWAEAGAQVVVHNLPWSCTWQTLKDAFSETRGMERADVIIDSSGRSR